jgi:hypothetical protein
VTAVTDQLAFRCARRGGACDCLGWSVSADACALDRALAADPPACDRCGRPTRLEDRFRLDHQATDDPAVTMQLVELRQILADAGVDTWGTDVLVYYCEPCDTAVAHFPAPPEEETP